MRFSTFTAAESAVSESKAIVSSTDAAVSVIGMTSGRGSSQKDCPGPSSGCTDSISPLLPASAEAEKNMTEPPHTTTAARPTKVKTSQILSNKDTGPDDRFPSFFSCISIKSILQASYSSSSKSKSSSMKTGILNSSSARRSFLVGRPVPRALSTKPLIRLISSNSYCSGGVMFSRISGNSLAPTRFSMA